VSLASRRGANPLQPRKKRAAMLQDTQLAPPFASLADKKRQTDVEGGVWHNFGTISAQHRQDISLTGS